MFSVIILDFDGSLSKKRKINRYELLRKLKTTACGVVTCKRHEAHTDMKFHAGAKYVRRCEMK